MLLCGKRLLEGREVPSAAAGGCGLARVFLTHPRICVEIVGGLIGRSSQVKTVKAARGCQR